MESFMNVCFGVKNEVIHWSKTQLHFGVTPFWSKNWSSTFEVLLAIDT